MSVTTVAQGPVTVITIDRPERRNAVDRATARELFDAFAAFDADPMASVAVLTGAGGTFCAGADLLAIAAGQPNEVQPAAVGSLAPMGPTRMVLGKPVIAAVEGHAVAGGLELAIWCDLRVAATDAMFGVLSRRFGVPLIDGGTIRLPRLIGQGRAVDMIATARLVAGPEAHAIGLVNRLADLGHALGVACDLAQQLAAFPQECLRADLDAARQAWDLPFDAALQREYEGGIRVLESGQSRAGADAFAKGAGRHGQAR